MLSCALDGADRGLEPAGVCLRRGVHLEHRARRRAPLHACCRCICQHNLRAPELRRLRGGLLPLAGEPELCCSARAR